CGGRVCRESESDLYRSAGRVAGIKKTATNTGSSVRTEPFVSSRPSPFRNASQGPVAALPGGGAPGALPEDADKNWKGTKGVDARWEHNLVVIDGQGNITEQWTQWDSLLKRAHAVYINPYDPEKYVWVVDDYSHAIFKFTNDGKKLAQT